MTKNNEHCYKFANGEEVEAGKTRVKFKTEDPTTLQWVEGEGVLGDLVGDAEGTGTTATYEVFSEVGMFIVYEHEMEVLK